MKYLFLVLYFSFFNYFSYSTDLINPIENVDFYLPENTIIVKNENISHEYDGNYVNKIIYTCKYSDHHFQIIFYFDYKEPLNTEARNLYYSNKKHNATKGYYDFGEAQDILKGNQKIIENDYGLRIKKVISQTEY